MCVTTTYPTGHAFPLSPVTAIPPPPPLPLNIPSREKGRRRIKQARSKSDRERTFLRSACRVRRAPNGGPLSINVINVNTRTREKKKKTERGKRKKRKKKERINPVALSGIYSCARTFVMFADRLRGIVAALGRIHRT
jgi:hypothetical protein